MFLAEPVVCVKVDRGKATQGPSLLWLESQRSIGRGHMKPTPTSLLHSGF